MRALVFKGPHQIAVEERRDPVPGPGEVLLRVLATGICGSALHGYTGENGRRHPGQVMGHETAARVAAIGTPSAAGPELTGRLAIDQLVTVNPVIGCGSCRACHEHTEQLCPRRKVIGVDPTMSAAFAEFMVVPAQNVVPLAAGVPPHLGAVVEPLAVGYHAARRGKITPGAAVLVLGGGPIGQAVALASRRLGAITAVSEIREARARLVRDLGFPVIDPGQMNVADDAVRVLGRRPDVVIDAVGTSATLGDALGAAAAGAVIVLVGMTSRELNFSAFELSTEERTITGSFCYSSTEFSETASWVGEHAADLAPLVGATVPLEDAPRAFADLADGTNPASKVLVLTS